MDANSVAVVKILKYGVLVLLVMVSAGCGWRAFVKKQTMTCDELGMVKHLNLSENQINQLELLRAKPLFEFSESDLDLYLSFMYATEPDQRKRIVHYARKALGQPYSIYLLGEFPFEMYDPDPLYILEQSDCLVFSEHMYAMALSWNWRSFFNILQRIRYKNGEISMVTRNHYTIPDWEQYNKWLLEDITDQVAPDMTKSLTVKTNRKDFFKKYNIMYDGEETIINTTYIPPEAVPEAIKHLKEGDFVNVIRGFEEPGWCGHTGLITIGADGTVNFLHSTPPRVREQPIIEYMEKSLAANPQKEKQKKARFYGYKFLRFRDDALERLRELDGADAPRVTGPRGILNEAPPTQP